MTEYMIVHSGKMTSPITDLDEHTGIPQRYMLRDPVMQFVEIKVFRRVKIEYLEKRQ